VAVSRLPKRDGKESATFVGEFPGGMGANVAATFVTLGGRAALFSAVGDDERGRRSLADLRATGVNVDGVLTTGDATFWTIALLDGHGEKSLLEFSTPASSPQWQRLDWSSLDDVKIAYTVGAEGRNACHLFDECRRRGIRTALDLESADLGDEPTLLELLATTDLLFIPAGHAEVIAKGRPPRVAARALLAAGPAVVAVTLGRRGCIVASAHDTIEVPGHKVSVLDTTGAGDCFVGAFLFAFNCGCALADCARLANLMAAQSVTAYGSRGRLLNPAQLAERPEAANLPILKKLLTQSRR
jgi:sugar/nucleoside kinase (ribokinase family)